MIINVILNRSCSTGKEWNIEALSCIYTIRQRFEMWFKMGSVRSYRCRSEKKKQRVEIHLKASIFPLSLRSKSY